MSSTFLIISPEHWDGHFVSKHHYALELARRGHTVLFHGPPDAAGPIQLVPVTDAPGDLRVLHAPRVAPGLRFLPGAFRRAMEARWLGQVEQLAGAPIEVVWSFENSRLFDLSFAGERLKIYHQVDLNQNFQAEIAANTADFVFCTSRPIKERLSTVRPDVKIIHHGVQTCQIDTSAERETFSREEINCVYAGNMSMSYLDKDLLLRSVQTYPNVLFHFFGGFEQGDPFQHQLSGLRNVRLHGKVASSRILPILTNADVLLVAYQKAHFEDQSNPHKMMEYMMSGKVIVATYTSEYEPVSDLLAMCSPNEDFVEVLGCVIRDIDSWNAKDQVRRRQAFAAENTYSQQIDRIADYIGPKSYLIS